MLKKCLRIEYSTPQCAPVCGREAVGDRAFIPDATFISSTGALHSVGRQKHERLDRLAVPPSPGLVSDRVGPDCRWSAVESWDCSASTARYNSTSRGCSALPRSVIRYSFRCRNQVAVVLATSPAVTSSWSRSVSTLSRKRGSNSARSVYEYASPGMRLPSTSVIHRPRSQPTLLRPGDLLTKTPRFFSSRDSTTSLVVYGSRYNGGSTLPRHLWAVCHGSNDVRVRR